MTQTNGRFTMVGSRYVAAFELNAAGLPAATSPSTVYTGQTVRGPNKFTVNAPTPRLINQIGEDRVMQIDYLPPNQALNAELDLTPMDFDFVAIASGVKKQNLAEASAIPIMTNLQGFEQQLALLCYQQALDLDSGARQWHSYLFPSARIIYLPPGFMETPEVVKFHIAPAITSQHLWGAALTTLLDGALSMQGLQMDSEGIPDIFAWKADGIVKTFTFPTDRNALTVNKISVWVAGVLSAPDTVAVDSITYTVAPAANAIIVVKSEHAVP